MPFDKLFRKLFGIKGMRLRKKKRKRDKQHRNRAWGFGTILRTSHIAHNRYRKIMQKFRVS